jgi:hypothetical protein
VKTIFESQELRVESENEFLSGEGTESTEEKGYASTMYFKNR